MKELEKATGEGSCFSYDDVIVLTGHEDDSELEVI